MRRKTTRHPETFVSTAAVKRFLIARPEWAGRVTISADGGTVGVSDDHAREALKLFVTATPDTKDNGIPHPPIPRPSAGPRLSSARLDQMESAAKGVVNAATYGHAASAHADAAHQKLWLIDMERRIQSLEAPQEFAAKVEAALAAAGQ